MANEQVPYGPHKIAQNGQVVIPREVLRQVDLSPGESVFVTVHGGIVELIPVSTLASWLRAGRPTPNAARGPGETQ